jgi:hypothetical protein
MWSLCLQEVPFVNLIEPGKQIKRKMDKPELPQMLKTK